MGIQRHAMDEPGVVQKVESPSEYAADFGKYKTPTLVIGGELDFRIPYTQELEFFTALQRQGVPSKLLIIPGRRTLGAETAE